MCFDQCNSSNVVQVLIASLELFDRWLSQKAFYFISHYLNDVVLRNFGIEKMN